MLQGKSDGAQLAGNAGKGRALFFGKGRCAECHMVEGAGGFLGSDLSVFAVTRSLPEIREAITNPNARERRGGKAVVTTRDGKQYSGVVRNEDNFSLQLQDLDGAFHLFSKTELTQVTRQSESLMPSDYGSTLSASELDDLIAFLASAANRGKNAAASKKKSNSDEEEEE
jgi:putative heme-binding domain-containing protein